MARIGNDLNRAKALLDANELVGIPTETVYGLAANALEEKAVFKIFETKKRPSFDPLIVHVHSIEQALELTHGIPSSFQKLMEVFWPGPLTLLLEKKQVVPDIVTSGLDTVAIRMPQHEVTLDLLKKLPYPLAAPSANPFGYISPTTAQHVNDQLGEDIAYILEGGMAPVGVESTILGMQEGKPTVFRYGGLSKSEIEAEIGEIGYLAHSTSNPKAPGLLKSHYAPSVPFKIGNIAQLLKTYSGKKVGILSFKERFEGGNIVAQEVLSPTGSIEEAAHHLFASMRKLDQSNLEVILAEYVPSVGLGMAINDRLKRAAAL